MNEHFSTFIKWHKTLETEASKVFCEADYTGSAQTIIDFMINAGAIFASVIVTDNSDRLIVLNGCKAFRYPKDDYVSCLPILFSQCDPVDMADDELEEFLALTKLSLGPSGTLKGRVFGIEIKDEQSAYFVSVYPAQKFEQADALALIERNERYLITTCCSLVNQFEGERYKRQLLQVQKERTIWLESLLWLNTASDELENSGYDKYYSEALFQLTVLVKSDECAIHRVSNDESHRLSLLNTLTENRFTQAIQDFYGQGLAFKKNEFLNVESEAKLAHFNQEYADVIIYPVYFYDRLVMILSLAKRQSCFEKNQIIFAGLFCQSIQKTLEKRKLLSSISKKNANLLKEKAEQAALIEKLHDTQDQLFQQEKMASIGQLAAGVAHEINNPVGYVNSNIGALEEYIVDLCEATSFLVHMTESDQCRDTLKQQIKAIVEKLDLDYIHEDSQLLVKESKEGILRVKQIVQDLKDFSHVDEAVWQVTDIKQGIVSTLNIVTNELKYKAEVITEFGDIPPVECVASQINQVVMNLLVNAGHAIEERGTIKIATSRVDELHVSIVVQDDGCGISEENLSKIFNPFFTTKPIGKGTGLGLSLSYSIIEKHGGTLQCASVIGEGTKFEIILPLKQAQAPEHELLSVGA